MRRRVGSPAGRHPIRFNGGYIFAEDPDRPAPAARVIWHADFDPGTLPVVATAADPTDPDSLRVERIAPWLTVVTDAAGSDHAVLSDGRHHIRLDVIEGRLAGTTAVRLHYRLCGIASAEARLQPLRQLLHLHRHRRFGRSLFPRDPWIDRGVSILRVHDALRDGASQRDIAIALFGGDRVNEDWSSASDSLRSRVRRLVRDARAMASGGYRQLMRKA